MFYRPVEANRYFSRGVRYVQVDWADFREVVRQFRARIHEWYLEPGNELQRSTWDYTFALMAIDCLLIDTMSQYHEGHVKSSQQQFKRFVASHLPALAASLPTPIRQPSGPPLHSFADVLYVGFRCGILHEAHVALYGGLGGLGGQLCDVDADVCTRYDDDGSVCPTVRMDPTAIFSELKRLFHEYMNDLLSPAHSQLRTKFKKKFKASFGIDLSRSTL
jgi:hypothetical protein